MKSLFLLFLLTSGTGSVLAQSAAKLATTAKPVATHSAASGIKLPPGVPPVHGIVKTAFSLRYQEIKIGTGALAEPNQIYKVHYTGWLAADGHKFDSSYDHPGQPVLDADGKPKLGDPQPFTYAQGFGRVIPGFDRGFEGMHVGGKRRVFIPWQLAYGERGRPGPDAAHPGIPPKADLIFDLELVAVTDMPMQMPMGHPGMMPGQGMPGGMTMHPGAPLPPGHPPVTSGTTAPAPPATPAQSATPGQPATPAQPQQ